MVTSIRFVSTHKMAANAAVTVGLYFVRYDATVALKARPQIQVIGSPAKVSRNDYIVVGKLVMEAGDAIVGHCDGAVTDVNYTISGVEQLL